MWYVYIVRCQNNALYTGITQNVLGRIVKHNSGKGSRSVIAHGLPVKLVYLEKHENKSSALKRECAVKKMSKFQKENMIKENPRGMQNS